jgi:hypothetical protein
MKRGNLISGILLLLLSAAVWIGSSAFPPESSFFPRALAIIMALLTLLMLFESHLDADEAVFDQGDAAYKRAAFVLLLTSAYSFLLGYFGFLVLTPISLLALMRIMEKGNYRWKIAASVLTTACIYFVFQMMLDVPLPAWSL